MATAPDEYPRRARLRNRIPLTPTGTVRLRFDVVDDEPFEVEPGQFVGVAVNVRGARRARTPYCVLERSVEERTFDLLVRVVPDGPVSLELGTMRAGTDLEFRGPLGRSMVPRELDRRIVLLATGVGISPYLFLVDVLAARGHTAPVKLYWGLRLDADLCLTDELDVLTRRHPDFGWVPTLSAPSPDWSGLCGRVTESVPPLLEDLDQTLFVFCGNGAMSEEMMAALATVGVSRRWMHDEPFFNRRHRARAAVVADIVERFAPDVRARALPTDPAELFPVDRPLNRPRRGDGDTLPARRRRS